MITESTNNRKRQKRSNDITSTRNSSPIRCINKLYTALSTYECAIHGQEIITSSKPNIMKHQFCVPCTYKIGAFDVALDEEFTRCIPNQRPECCPRIGSNTSSSKENFLSSYGYHEGMNILCVGDGDFTFSLALARTLLANNNQNTCTRIVASSYEALPTLESIYGKDRFSQTRHELEKLGVTILYKVDATQLRDTLPDQQQRCYYHRIVFNFPCTAVENGQDGQNNEMEQNKLLIRNFTKSAMSLLHPTCGEIHMAHKTKPPFDQWNLEQEVVQNHCGISYCGRIVFDRCCFLPYTPRKAKHSKSFTYHDACIYVFGLKSTNATNNLLDFPPTIPSNERNTSGLIPVTKEMIQHLRSAHLANTRSFVGKVAQSSPKKKKQKKQSIK